MDPPGRGKRYTCSRGEEEVDRCTDVPVWQSHTQSRTHIAGECETYEKEWGVLEGETRG